MRWLSIYFLLIAITCAGQAVDETDEAGRSQTAVENRTISNMAFRFTLYSQANSNVAITSLVQVLEITNSQQLASIEAIFRQFGTNAGFENSILEKYVFLPQGVQTGDSIGGEVFLISAKPFFDRDGIPRRSLIAKKSDGKYRGIILKEDYVSRMVAAVGVTIPEPAPVILANLFPNPITNSPSTNSHSRPNPIQDKPGVSLHSSSNNPASRQDPLHASNSVSQTEATATPGNGTSWLGLIIVLGMGVLFSIFLLFRTKQK